MSKWLDKVTRARPELEVDWSPERSTKIETGLHRRRRERVISRAVIVVALVAIVYIWESGNQKPPAQTAVPARKQSPSSTVIENGPTIDFADGSKAAMLSANTAVTPVLIAREHIEVELTRGTAHFEVSKRAERVFEVLAGKQTLTTTESQFTVTKEADEVNVEVSSGQVHIRSGPDDITLMAGERRLFGAPPAPAPRSPKPAAGPRDMRWKELAQQGEYAAAYEAMLDGGGATAVANGVDELLLAADVARLSHNPKEAVAPLQQLVAEHPGDPMAASASFTLGRMLRDDLHDARAAAEAFATTVRLDPSGALAEDAWAREVDAWAAAGETSWARQRALDFEEKYPAARRLEAVRHAGGLK